MRQDLQCGEVAIGFASQHPVVHEMFRAELDKIRRAGAGTSDQLSLHRKRAFRIMAQRFINCICKGSVKMCMNTSDSRQAAGAFPKWGLPAWLSRVVNIAVGVTP